MSGKGSGWPGHHVGLVLAQSRVSRNSSLAVSSSQLSRIRWRTAPGFRRIHGEHSFACAIAMGFCGGRAAFTAQPQARGSPGPRCTPLRCPAE